MNGRGNGNLDFAATAIPATSAFNAKLQPDIDHLDLRLEDLETNAATVTEEGKKDFTSCTNA